MSSQPHRPLILASTSVYRRQLLERLRLRGYTQEAIADVAGENFRRYLDAIPGRPTA